MMRSLFEIPAISVGELCRRIRQALQQQFPSPVRVLGEVSKCRVVDGNVYFSLKDTQGFIDCVCFRNAAQQLQVRLPLADGVAVEVDGRVDIYDRKSAYQLIVEDIVAVGKGALHLEFENVKERLRREGLFEESRKRPIPAFIRNVAIVTSENAAALHDFVTACRRRGAHVRITLVHAPVQGAGAAPVLARAIRSAGRMQVDVVVVARGGGSIEDLWAFNTEQVARAIVACQRPVISAVGHETDFTIADFVADWRAATPTAAAEFVARERAELLQRIDRNETRLRRAWLRAAENTLLKLNALTGGLRRAGLHAFWLRVQQADDAVNGLSRADPRKQIEAWKQRTEQARKRLPGVQSRLLHNQAVLLIRARRALQKHFLQAAAMRTAKLQLLESRLTTLAPRETLRRGYAIVYDDHGDVLTDARKTSRGRPIEVELKSGWLCATVDEKREAHEKNAG